MNLRDRALRLARISKQFRSNVNGAIAITFALASGVLMIVVGMAVDYSAANATKTKLQSALDSAALAATKSLLSNSSDEAITKLVGDMVTANTGFLREAIKIDVTIDRAQKRVNVQGSVNHETFLLPIIGVNSIPVSAKSEAATGRTQIELALVLDNSTSMQGSRITHLRTEARNLAEYVLDLAADRADTKVALIPFTLMVNVDPQNASSAWMDRPAQSPIHGQNLSPAANRFTLYQSLKNESWAGCVEVRPAPHDVTDSTPTAADPASLFVPSFAPDEPDGQFPVQIGGRNYVWAYYNNYISDTPSTCPALPNGATPLQKQERTCKYTDANVNLAPSAAGTRGGPNFACDSQPIIPLTDTKLTITTAIDKMIAYGGTNIHEGLMWGWRVLSPDARFTEGRSYNAVGNVKIMVLMTDGENDFPGIPYSINNSLYTSYGYSKANRLGTTSSDAKDLVAAMNARTKLACQNAKKAGIQIYTIAWYVTEKLTLDLLKECATKPSMAAAASSDGELTAIFESIAQQIGQLRIAR